MKNCIRLGANEICNRVTTKVGYILPTKCSGCPGCKGVKK